MKNCGILKLGLALIAAALTTAFAAHAQGGEVQAPPAAIVPAQPARAQPAPVPAAATRDGMIKGRADIVSIKSIRDRMQSALLSDASRMRREAIVMEAVRTGIKPTEDEEILARQRVKFGSASDADVEISRMTLSRSRLRKAMEHHDWAQAKQHQEEIIAARITLERASQARLEAGLIAPAWRNLMRIGVAEARIQAEQLTIAAARYENLKDARASHEAGKMTELELEQANLAYEEAVTRVLKSLW